MISRLGRSSAVRRSTQVRVGVWNRIRTMTAAVEAVAACASRIPNSLAASRIEAPLRGAWRLAYDNEVRSHASLKDHTLLTLAGGHMGGPCRAEQCPFGPTAGTWSSSQWRPDHEFETDRATGSRDDRWGRIDRVRADRRIRRLSMAASGGGGPLTGQG